MRRDDSTLRDVLEAIDRIERALGGVDEARFVADELRRSAVAGSLLVLGEACSRLSEEARARAPAIRWRELAALPPLLARDDGDIDWPLVWRTTRSLPEVRRVLAALSGA